MNAIEHLHQHRGMSQKLDRLEDELRAQPRELRDAFAPEIFHHFAPGLYAREMRLRAGAVITSLVHKHPGLSILSRGVLDLLMPDGTVRRVSAGFHIVAPAGTRRAAVCIEDATWTCMHPTELTDLNAIKRHFIADTEAEYLAWSAEQLAISTEKEPHMSNTNEVQS